MGSYAVITVNLLFLPSRFEALGYTCKFFKTEAGINVGMSALRRYLKSLGLFSLNGQSDMLDVALFRKSGLMNTGCFIDFIEPYSETEVQGICEATGACLQLYQK